MAYCYLLYTDEGQTYVGATVDPDRRLRQHNQELVGGARATGIRVAQGLVWKRACYLTGIPEWRTALQVEWRWKQLSRKIYKKGQNPLQRRAEALKILLSLDRSTTKAKPFCEWENAPEVVSEDEEFLRELSRELIVPL